MSNRFAALLTFALMMVVALPIRAENAPADPERLAAARSLMEATGAARQFDAVMPMMVSQMEPLFLQMAPGKEKEIKEVMGLMVERFGKRKSELFEEIATLYSEKMSTADMKELTQFFGSGVGQRFIQMQPEIVQSSMLIGQRWGQKIGEEIERDVREELAKRGIKI